MKNVLFVVVFLFLSITIFSCGTKPPISRKDIKIIFTGLPSYLIDDSGKLSDNSRNLFSEIVSTDEKCKYTYILDPTLIRLDANIEQSISTKIERSGISEATNPNRVIKLVKQNLESLILPENFIKKSSLKFNTDSLLTNFILNKTGKDSILVFAEKPESDSTTLNGKRYKIINSIDEIRTRLLSILCHDEKAKITLFVNPPIPPVGQKKDSITQVVSESVSSTSTSATVTVMNKENNGLRKTNKTLVNRNNFYPGVLTIIKGSEGCDICTRYYSATDELGRTHEVREKNSTNCCPCGKTIEMQGRTYRMDCEGSPHLVVE